MLAGITAENLKLIQFKHFVLKNALDLSVNIFSTKVLIGDTKVLPLAVQFEYLNFSVIF